MSISTCCFPARTICSFTAFAFAFLGNSAVAIAQTIRQTQQTDFWGEGIIPELRARHISRGYADYWYAYAIDYFTNEEIILEPTITNYSPHYGPLVRAEHRVGYLRPDPLTRTPDSVIERPEHHQPVLGLNGDRRDDRAVVNRRILAAVDLFVFRIE